MLSQGNGELKLFLQPLIEMSNYNHERNYPLEISELFSFQHPLTFLSRIHLKKLLKTTQNENKNKVKKKT